MQGEELLLCHFLGWWCLLSGHLSCINISWSPDNYSLSFGNPLNFVQRHHQVKLSTEGHRKVFQKLMAWSLFPEAGWLNYLDNFPQSKPKQVFLKSIFQILEISSPSSNFICHLYRIARNLYNELLIVPQTKTITITQSRYINNINNRQTKLKKQQYKGNFVILRCQYDES